MISKFGHETALLVIDAQLGVNHFQYWGGEQGRRNNPEAETRIADLLAGWRQAGLAVCYTQHDSREPHSPLKLALASGRIIEGLEPLNDELVITKDVNSAFLGTGLELSLRRLGVSRLVVCGFFTNMCVETSVRMAGNMGYDTYLCHDACACCNRVGPDGTDHGPELIHATSLANLHGEFCTTLMTREALSLLEGDRPDLERSQGNE